MKPYAQELYRTIKAAHEAAVKTIAKLETDIQAACQGSKEECADIAYALREVREFAEDIRKRADALGRTSQAAACMLALAEANAQSIGTEYCSAALMCKTIVDMPKQKTDPEAFANVMHHLGVPESLWNLAKTGKEHCVIAPHWPGLMELLSEQTAQGLPLPKGIDPNKSFTEYSLRIRGRKSVDADYVPAFQPQSIQQSAESVF